MQPLDYVSKGYKEILIFGDLHGCFSPLKKIFDKFGLKEDTKYIFLGDYEDRGIEHAELFEFLLKHRKSPNFLFLRGNHTIHSENFANDKPVGSREFKNVTCHALAHIDKKELAKFCRDQAAFCYFRFYDKAFLCTHGGMPNLPTIFTNESEMVHGVGGYNDSELIKEMFAKNTPPNVYQIHGHRNVYKVPIDDGTRTLNLEGGVEHGGILRCVRLFEESGVCRIEPVEVQNEIFAKNEDGKFTSKMLISALKANPFVKQSELKDGITSYKFTKECFFKGVWDNVSTRARGLFVRGEKVVARSYDKFFNLGEMMSEEQILQHVKMPVRFYQKENGFLGILSYDGGLHFFSKSTDEGWFANFFKNEFEAMHAGALEKVAKFLEQNDFSMVFEVCNSQKDPHMVECEKTRIVLLDIFKNDFKEERVSYEKLQNVAEELGVECKKLTCVVEEKEALRAKLRELEGLREVEGFVAEDADGYKFKLKTKWYLFWKMVRAKEGRNLSKVAKALFGDGEFDGEFDEYARCVKVAQNLSEEELLSFFEAKAGFEGEFFNVIKFRTFVKGVA